LLVTLCNHCFCDLHSSLSFGAFTSRFFIFLLVDLICFFTDEISPFTGKFSGATPDERSMISLDLFTDLFCGLCGLIDAFCAVSSHSFSGLHDAKDIGGYSSVVICPLSHNIHRLFYRRDLSWQCLCYYSQFPISINL